MGFSDVPRWCRGAVATPRYALAGVADREGAVVRQIDGGGLVVTNEDSPTSVYLAYPDGRYQVEVYDPDPELALELASSGQVRPVP